MDGEGLLNEELPNCWECPKCYQEDSSEKTQVRELSPNLHCEKEGSIKLRITFAFASLFARLFFILFCLLSFFFLWLIIFLLNFKFCFFVLLNIVPLGGLQIPEVLLQFGALEKEEPQLGCLRREMRWAWAAHEEWNLRGGSDLSQLVNTVVYLSFQLGRLHFCHLHLCGRKPCPRAQLCPTEAVPPLEGISAMTLAPGYYCCWSSGHQSCQRTKKTLVTPARKARPVKGTYRGGRWPHVSHPCPGGWFQVPCAGVGTRFLVFFLFLPT